MARNRRVNALLVSFSYLSAACFYSTCQLRIMRTLHVRHMGSVYSSAIKTAACIRAATACFVDFQFLPIEQYHHSVMEIVADTFAVAESYHV